MWGFKSHEEIFLDQIIIKPENVMKRYLENSLFFGCKTERFWNLRVKYEVQRKITPH